VDVPTWVWFATIVGILLVLAFDLFVVDLHPHLITVREAGKWVVIYVAAAAVFGFGLFLVVGGRYAGEFFAGYITEYSLSVDNLFIFVIIMSTFAVPAIHQHKVLLFGILCALVLRGAFIAAGAAVITRFQWVFYLFGAFLLYTAWNLAFPRSDEGDEYRENRAIQLARRLLPVTDEYHGARTVVRVNGRRYVTPLLVVMIAIGTTDLLFALDSIPAIFGLTKEPYLVFTANAFALMGLRQLFFLLGGLLNRLIYLDKGLSVILGFIGVKLVFEAMASSGLHWAPHIGVVQSLAVIISVLTITTVASLLKVRADPSAARSSPMLRGSVPANQSGATADQGAADSSGSGPTGTGQDAA
jgi:tellurite resistance protein TerC